MRQVCKRLSRARAWPPAWATALATAAAICCSAPLRAETVTVALWGSAPSELAAFDRAAAAFTRATGIAVQKQVIEDKYMDVLKSRFAGHKPPDVFYLDAYEAPLLIASGALEPLDAQLDNGADFYPQFLRAFKGADGKLYGIPKDYSTLALYLNPVLLRQAGVRPDQVPTDFTALMRFARGLQPKLPQGVAAMIIEKDLARHLSALEAYGQPVVTAGGNASFARNPGAYQYLNELVTGHAAHYLFSPKDDLGADWPGAAFGTGKAAMMMEGNWVQAALKHDYADVPFVTRAMPSVNGRPQTMAFVVGYAVSREARNKSGAFKFARFMTGPGLRLWLSAAGNLPARRSVEAEMGLAADPAMRPHVDGASYATVWSRGDALPIMNFNFGSQFLAAFNGTKPLAAALEKAEAVSNREIERQR
jgi:multiple sugar transport system substrate-binding protein